MHIRPTSTGRSTLHTSNRSMFGASVVTSREADPDWAPADHLHNVLSAPPSPSTLQAQVSQVLSRASPEFLYCPPALRSILQTAPFERTIPPCHIDTDLIPPNQYGSLQGALVDVRFSVHYDFDSTNHSHGFSALLHRLHVIEPPSLDEPAIQPPPEERLSPFTH